MKRFTRIAFYEDSIRRAKRRLKKLERDLARTKDNGARFRIQGRIEALRRSIADDQHCLNAAKRAKD